MTRATVRFAVRLTLGVVLLGFILSRIDFSGLTIHPTPSVFAGVGLAALLLLISQCTAALRWKVIMGPGSPPWTYLARLYVIGGFFSLFLPTVVGGDAVRAAATAQSTGRTGSAVTSVLLDRLFGLSALLIYLITGFLAAPDAARAMIKELQVRVPSRTAVVALGLAAIVTATLLLVFRRSPALHRLLEQARWAVVTLAKAPGTAAKALALGLVVQGLFILIWVALGRILVFELPLTTYLVAVPLVTLGTMIPITLAGLGVREGAWLILLNGSGLSNADVVGYSLLFLAGNLLAGAVGGLLFVLRGTLLQQSTTKSQVPAVLANSSPGESTQLTGK